MEQFFLALKITLVLLPYCRVCSTGQDRVCEGALIRRPDVVRTIDGANATFHWEINSGQAFSRMWCSYGNADMFEMFINSGSVTTKTAYSSRLTFDSGSGKVSFTLEDVGQNDITENYTASFMDTGGSICNDTSMLYIYSSPSTPTIEVYTAIAVNSVTLICHSEPTSRPGDLRRPVTYTWTIGGASVGALPGFTVSRENNDTLEVSVLREYLGHELTCEAREIGSPLTSQARAALRAYGSGLNGSIISSGREDEQGAGGDQEPRNVYKLVLFGTCGVIAVLGAAAGLAAFLYRRRARKPRSVISLPDPDAGQATPAQGGGPSDPELGKHGTRTMRKSNNAYYMDMTRGSSGVYSDLEEGEMSNIERSQNHVFLPAKNSTLPSVPEEERKKMHDADEYLLPITRRK